MYDFSREVNRLLAEGRLSKKGAGNALSVYDRFNSLFDVLREPTRAVSTGDLTGREGVTAEEISSLLGKASLEDSEVDLLLIARKDARSRKDFSTADNIRNRLSELGIEIQDTQEGAVWKRK
jgi:cysteinyl-tRNA synthetase